MIQLAHALQYLSFTNRVEYNLQSSKDVKVKVVKSVILMLFLILSGYLVVHRSERRNHGERLVPTFIVCV